MAIWNILQTFGIFYDHLVHFVFIWFIFSSFGITYQEKSGNPDVVSASKQPSKPVVISTFFRFCNLEKFYGKKKKMKKVCCKKFSE
jgi:hypothetical protein